MRKDELRKLRTLKATREMVEKAEKNMMKETVKHWWNEKSYEVTLRKYQTFFRCQNLGGYLKIAIFMPENMQKGITTPKYELFINEEGKEWITRELDDSGKEERWLTAMIDNLPGLYNYYETVSEEAWINADGMRSIGRLKFEKGNESLDRYKGFWRIVHWQRCIREERIEEREKKEQAPWDKDMALIPEAPKRFTRWMQKEVPEKNYIFYKYEKRGAKTGYCRYCEEDVPLKQKPHHRGEILCPKCKRKSVLISTGKIRRVDSDEEEAQIIQKIDGGIVLRKFRVSYRINTVNYKEPKYWVHEEVRTLYRGRDIKRYSYESYKNKYTRWCLSDRASFIYENGKMKIYRGNLRAISKDIEKNSGIAILIQEEKRFSVERYMYEERKHPVLEKLVKAGLEDLALEFVNIDISYDCLQESQGELAKILNLDKERMGRLKKIGGSSAELYWLQEEKRQDTVWDDDMVRYFAEAGLKQGDFKFLGNKMSLKKIYNYLKKQERLSGDGAKQLLRTWRDYMQMAQKLKMNTELEIYYKPRNLNEAHAEAIEIIEKNGMKKIARDTEKKFPKVNEVCATLGKYEWNSGKFCIKAPQGIYDIVREGAILHHCIHTCDYYFDRISNRESYLLFLRKTGQEDMPWYTLEVEPGGNIRQKRTTGDNQNPDLNEALPFLRKWQQEIKKRLSKEEEELAKIADRKRRENYEDVRKKEKRVWHGKLQGMLLADVLEQDFMEAL